MCLVDPNEDYEESGASGSEFALSDKNDKKSDLESDDESEDSESDVDKRRRGEKKIKKTCGVGDKTKRSDGDMGRERNGGREK